jgi:hypothetical protein
MTKSGFPSTSETLLVLAVEPAGEQVPEDRYHEKTFPRRDARIYLVESQPARLHWYWRRFAGKRLTATAAS